VFCRKYSQSSLYAVGFSLGGLVLTKYLSEAENQLGQANSDVPCPPFPGYAPGIPCESCTKTKLEASPGQGCGCSEVHLPQCRSRTEAGQEPSVAMCDIRHSQSPRPSQGSRTREESVVLHMPQAALPPEPSTDLTAADARPCMSPAALRVEEMRGGNGPAVEASCNGFGDCASSSLTNAAQADAVSGFKDVRQEAGDCLGAGALDSARSCSQAIEYSSHCRVLASAGQNEVRALLKEPCSFCDPPWSGIYLGT
jgi:hypothetical protein